MSFTLRRFQLFSYKPCLSEVSDSSFLFHITATILGTGFVTWFRSNFFGFVFCCSVDYAKLSAGNFKFLKGRVDVACNTAVAEDFQS